MKRTQTASQVSEADSTRSGQAFTGRQDEALRQLFLRVDLPPQTLFEQTRFEKGVQARLERRGVPRALRWWVSGGLTVGVALASLLVWLSASPSKSLLEEDTAAVAERSSEEADGYPRWLALTADAETILAPSEDVLGIDDSSLYPRASQGRTEPASVAATSGHTADLTEQSPGTTDSDSAQRAQLIALAKVMTEDVLELDPEDEFLPADYQALDGIWASSL